MLFGADSGKSSGILISTSKRQKMNFCEKVSRINKKRLENQCFKPQKLELIARFELATSSLPKIKKQKIECYSLL